MFTNRNNSVITLALIGAGLAMSAQAVAGSASSGGGSAIQPAPHQQPVLLDYYLANPRFVDIPALTNDRIAVSTFANTIGYDRLDVKSWPSYQLAQARLKVWEKNSPVVVNLIHVALDAMEWTYTPFRQDLCGEAKETNESLHLGLPLESVVVFRKEFGASISARVWNSMGGYSHGGLMVHEALRHIQLVVGEPMDYSVLMTVTAKIMLENPGQQAIGFTLDNPQSFKGEIKKQIEYAQSFTAGAARYCQELSDETEQTPVLSTQIAALKQGFCEDFVSRASDPNDRTSVADSSRFDSLMAADEKVRNLMTALAGAAHDAYLADQITLAQYNHIVNIGIESAEFTIGRNQEATDRTLLQGAGSLAAIGRATSALSGGFSEETLRQYLNGDHSGFSIFTRPKINRAIEQAQAKLQQMMQDNFSLRCE